MTRQLAATQNIDRYSDILTPEEAERLAEHGPAFVSWARRVRLESQALEDLLSGAAGANIVPFGRRSSAAWR